MGIKIEALVADINKGGSAGMEVCGVNVKEKSNEMSVLSNDDNQAKVNKVCNAGTSPLPEAPVGENGQRRRSNINATARNDAEMLMQAPSLASAILKQTPASAMQMNTSGEGTSISSKAGQHAMDRVMNAGASKVPSPASAAQVDSAVNKNPPVVIQTSGGVVSVEVYGEEEEDVEEKDKKRGTVEVKSEPVEVELGADDPQGQAALVPSSNNADTADIALAPSANIALVPSANFADIALASSANLAEAPSANTASSEKRKESPASEADEVRLKKKKLLDVVLHKLSDTKSSAGGEESNKGSNNASKPSKLKRKATDTKRKAFDTNNKPADKAVKGGGDNLVNLQGRRESQSSTAAVAMDSASKTGKGVGDKNISLQGRRGSIPSTVMDRVMGAGASKPTKSKGENTSVKIASSTLMSDKGGATTDFSRRKSEPSSTMKTSLAAKKEPQASKLSNQGKKKQKNDLGSLKSKNVLASSSSMENLSQMPGLTITPNPNSTPQPHLISSNLPEPTNPTLPPVLLANAPALALASAGAAAKDLKPSVNCPSLALNKMGQSEVASQVGEVEIAQKAEEEEEKGCNYSLTCELCQKENKTLQSLYNHVIVHIRVELERKVKDLMEGFQCKVCDQVFKAKAPLLAHIGCKHGKVNDILKEKGYNVLPCLLATNGKSGEEMQANLVQIKKEKTKILAE